MAAPLSNFKRFIQLSTVSFSAWLIILFSLVEEILAPSLFLADCWQEGDGRSSRDLRVFLAVKFQ